MDIFTHVMIGATATSPFWASHPLESVAFTFGSVLPDIDAVSRQFGKVAYLRAHQTWTHAVPLQVAATVLFVTGLVIADLTLFVPSALALGAGMIAHSLLDWTNTYGVKLFAPFDRARRSLEWVFFIDAFVIGTTGTALALQAAMFARSGSASTVIALGWAVLMAAYVAMKAALRRRARRRVPAAVSLVPSALWPWRFYALVIERDRATTATVDGWNGEIADERHHQLGSAEGLETLAEYRVMRELSVGFYPTRVTDERIVCEDLRTRNFGTNFGRLTVNTSTTTPAVEAFDV